MEQTYNQLQETELAKSTSKKHEVPLSQKLCLTIEEAAAYSNIGICKLKEISRQPNCPFTLYIGKKKLIKRPKFEEYLMKAIEV